MLLSLSLIHDPETRGKIINIHVRTKVGRKWANVTDHLHPLTVEKILNLSRNNGLTRGQAKARMIQEFRLDPAFRATPPVRFCRVTVSRGGSPYPVSRPSGTLRGDLAYMRQLTREGFTIHDRETRYK